MSTVRQWTEYLRMQEDTANGSWARGLLKAEISYMNEKKLALRVEKLKSEIECLKEDNEDLEGLCGEAAVERDTVDAEYEKLRRQRMSVELELEELEGIAEYVLGEEREKRKCRMCLTEYADALLLPCHHVLYCLRCSEKIELKCPWRECRMRVMEIIPCTLPAVKAYADAHPSLL